jgi:uncharacterized protein YecT (DUF1311 family)
MDRAPFGGCVLPLCTLLATLACAPGDARADDMDGWCAQVKKASSVVICSDAELREQANARNKLFDAARAKLSPEAYKALTDDQSRWIKSYTARCGILIDDPPPPLPIPQSVIDCYRRESHARTNYLATYLSVPNPMASAPNPFDQFDDAGNPRPQPAPTIPATLPSAHPGNAAVDQWKRCVMGAADALANQPEPAQTVAEAAFGNCVKYEVAVQKAGGLSVEGLSRIRSEAMAPMVVARVMADRQARQEVGPPTSSLSEASEHNLEKWIECTDTAVDVLADQLEPAETLVAAVFGSCLTEQLAFQKSTGLSDGKLEAERTAVMGPPTLARVIAVRAARAKLRKESPQTKPAIDHGRM